MWGGKNQDDWSHLGFGQRARVFVIALGRGPKVIQAKTRWERSLAVIVLWLARTLEPSRHTTAMVLPTQYSTFSKNKTLVVFLLNEELACLGLAF